MYSVLMLETEDFDSEPLTVIMSETQREVCVHISIVADSIGEPDEVFNIELTSNTTDVTVLQGRSSAEVIISDTSKLIIV